MGLFFQRNFFKGNSATQPRAFDGLQVLCDTEDSTLDGTGRNLITTATNGGPLDRYILDKAIECVAGQGEGGMFAWYGDYQLQAELNELFYFGNNSAPQTMEMFGMQVPQYGGIPFMRAGNGPDKAKNLGFDETVGTNSTTASLYLMNFDPQIGVIASQDKPLEFLPDATPDAASVWLERAGQHAAAIALRLKNSAVRIRGIVKSVPTV
jgi:hypothetical protein